MILVREPGLSDEAGSSCDLGGGGGGTWQNLGFVMKLEQ